MSAPTPRPLPAWATDVPLAHRGLHGPGVPENSLAAFTAAAAAHVGVELDVHVTSDGVPVVVHDASLERTAGLDVDVREVEQARLAPARLGDGSAVPTLAGALQVLTEVPVMVEVKNLGRATGRIEEAVAGVLDDHPGPFVVASFHPGTVGWFAQARPGMLRARTVGWLPELPGGVAARLTQRWLTSSGLPDLLSVDVDEVAHAAVTRLRGSGLPVVAWTVRTPGQLEHAHAHADNVIFEDLAPEVVRRAGRPPVEG